MLEDVSMFSEGTSLRSTSPGLPGTPRALQIEYSGARVSMNFL
jgi:hypothetical protein